MGNLKLRRAPGACATDSGGSGEAVFPFVDILNAGYEVIYGRLFLIPDSCMMQFHPNFAILCSLDMELDV